MDEYFIFNRKIHDDKVIGYYTDGIVTCSGLTISINEDELKMALAYDRDQYEKGYSDGRADREEEIIKCKDCVHRKKLIYEVSEKGNNILKVCELIKLQVNDDFHCGWGKNEENDGT